MQLDIFERPHPFWWWEMHDWQPKPGALCMCSGLVRHADGQSFAEFFRDGYLLEVDDYHQEALCYFPKLSDAPWVDTVVGVVAFHDLNPITECDFDEISWRVTHPCPEPEHIIREYREAAAQSAGERRGHRQRAP